MSALILAAALAQNVTTVPVAGPDQRLAGGNPAILRIARNGATGTVAVYGAELPGVNSDNYRKIIAGGAAAQTTDMAFAAFANYNWIVKRNGVILGYAASPADLTEFSVSDSGGFAVITIGDGDPLPTGDTIEIFFVTPAVIQAAAVTENVIANIRSYDVLWAVGSNDASFSSSVVAIEPVVP